MNGHSILVADDDTSVIAALKLLLQTHRFEVVAVTTPQALLEQLAKREFTAALIDLNYQKDTTSGHEGLALIEQIRKRDEHLPIIAMTGYSSIEIAVEAMKLGAADFVQKPWSNERLLHTLNTQITLNQVRQAGDKLAQELMEIGGVNFGTRGSTEFYYFAVQAESAVPKLVAAVKQKIIKVYNSDGMFYEVGLFARYVK